MICSVHSMIKVHGALWCSLEFTQFVHFGRSSHDVQGLEPLFWM
jgi:hypothetical protein